MHVRLDAARAAVWCGAYPKPAASCMCSAYSLAYTISFLGTQPRSTHVPPTPPTLSLLIMPYGISATATLLPACSQAGARMHGRPGGQVSTEGHPWWAIKACGLHGPPCTITSHPLHMQHAVTLGQCVCLWPRPTIGGGEAGRAHTTRARADCEDVIVKRLRRGLRGGGSYGTGTRTAACMQACAAWPVQALFSAAKHFCMHSC